MNFQIKHLVNFPELQDEFQSLIDNNWDTIGTLDDVGWDHWFDFVEKNQYQFEYMLTESFRGWKLYSSLEDVNVESLPDNGWQFGIKIQLWKGKKSHFSFPLFLPQYQKILGNENLSNNFSEFKNIAIKYGAKALIALLDLL